MGVLAKFTKQPADVQDYDIDFNELWLTGLNDTAIDHTVTQDAGITVVTSTLLAGVVKVFLSGGVDGQKYKITVQVTTTGGRVKEVEILVAVKET